MTVDVHTGEIVESHLSAADARALTDRIRGGLSVAYDGLVEAWQGRADLALGYESWDAYCAGEFTEGRMVRLDREQRREIVASMRSAGMSTRAIGSALGIGNKTAARDASPVSPDTGAPATVRSLDGRDRPATKPPTSSNSSTAGTSPAPPHRPLPDAFRDAAYDLVKAVERIQRLTDDDRFTRNAQQVSQLSRGDLLRAADALAGVIQRLP